MLRRAALAVVMGLWIGKRIETVMHGLFSLLWLFLTSVHGLAWWQVSHS